MGQRASDSANRVLAERHGRFLAFLRNRVASDAIAEDILQDAYAKSLQKIDDVRDGESVVAWFYSILKNAVTDHYRKAGVERRVHAELGQEGEPSVEPESPTRHFGSSSQDPRSAAASKGRWKAVHNWQRTRRRVAFS